VRRVAIIVIAMMLASLAVAAPLARAATLDPAGADSVVLHARHEGLDDFCAKPSRPLSTHARSLCPMAAGIPQCDAFVAACNDKPFDPDKLPRWNLGLGAALASLAGGVVWLLVAAVIGLIVVFVVSAIGRARKDSRLASSPEPKATVVPDPMAEALLAPSDAEALLARASEHALRGELDRAALLYLAAALRALDRRGAIRIARHRTNGEYVRACKDGEAAPQLRAIVRAVDRVQFGHEAPTREAIADVAARAAWIVRAAVVASLLLLLVGCTPKSHGPILQSDDPGGDDLFMAVLERQGADVARLGGSLASLPMPEHDEKGPLVVVDAARTLLEEETRMHLVRWVKAGGRLLIAGDVKSWPEDFGAKPHESSSSKLTFRFPDPENENENERVVDPADATFKATVAEPHGLDWNDELGASYVLAKNDEEVPYAAARAFERGVVVGLAGDDLLTNAGISVPPNAAAIVALIERYAHGRAIRVARPEDGISPPSSPLAALLGAGLGLPLAHAAFATALLMLAVGVRQARARREPPPQRRAWTEHVAATGSLYARAHLAPHALSAYARFVDGRLRARMPRTMTDPAVYLALRSRADAARCAEVWALATAARSADRPRGDELATLRELRTLYAAAMKTG